MGAWVLGSVIAIVAGGAVAIVAGTIAIMRHPNRDDPERNAQRYVKPALVGFTVAVLGVLSLIAAIIGIVIEATT